MTDYQFYKRMGICPQCKKNKIMGSESHCPECRAYQADLMAKIYKENRNNIRERKRLAEKEILTYRRNNGLCYKCGKQLINLDYKSCKRCRERIKAYKLRVKSIK